MIHWGGDWNSAGWSCWLGGLGKDFTGLGGWAPRRWLMNVRLVVIEESCAEWSPSSCLYTYFA